MTAEADKGAADQAVADALGRVPSDAVLDKVAALRSRVENMHALAEEFGNDPGMLIPGLMPNDVRFGMITGPSKAGKTWLAHALVISLGNGLPFLGLFPLSHQVEDHSRHDHLGRPAVVDVEGVGEPQRTLYVQAENSRWSMESRTRAILRGLGAEFAWDEEEGVPVILGAGAENVDLLLDPGLDITTADGIDALSAVVALGGYRNVVLDSAYNFVPGSLNDDEVAKRAVAGLKEFHRRTECRVLVDHHTSAKGGPFATGESMGSTFWTSAWFDWELRMTPRAGDRSVLLTPFGRDLDETCEPVRVRMVTAGRWELVTDEASAAEALAALGALEPWLEERGLRVYRTGQGGLRISGRGNSQEAVAGQLGVSPLALREAMSMLADRADAA